MKERNYSQEIWDLRGELDKAIIEKNTQKIAEIQDNLHNFLLHQYNSMFLTFAMCFESAASMEQDIRKNKNIFANNVKDICYKHLKDKNHSAKFKQEPMCVASTLWVARAMYDDALRIYLKDDFKQNEYRCMELFESVLEALDLCKKCIHDAFESWNISSIREEVSKNRYFIFGDKEFIQGFKHNCKEY